MKAIVEGTMKIYKTNYLVQRITIVKELDRKEDSQNLQSLIKFQPSYNGLATYTMGGDGWSYKKSEDLHNTLVKVSESGQKFFSLATRF
jgi:hypothetical protein